MYNSGDIKLALLSFFKPLRVSFYVYALSVSALVNASTDLNISLQGSVIEGRKEARTLGCPTANIEFNAQDTSLESGVYAARTQVDTQTINSIAYYNKDWRPTTLESHLFDWNKDLYGQTITITLMHLIRPSMDFSKLLPEEIRAQIQNDVQQAKNWHEQ